MWKKLAVDAGLQGKLRDDGRKDAEGEGEGDS